MFGLLLEARRAEDPAVLTARCFIKQDHQGPERGCAHPGVIAAAVSEAMSLVCGPVARVSAFEVTITGPARVGTFLDLSAKLESGEAQAAHTVAVATCDGSPVATASGTYSL